ncbi:MAG: helix-turn-helix transcriptional regulator [Burkholderia gladioli]
MSLAGRLHEERKRLRLSQVEFGALGGMGGTAVVAWEKGTASPTATFLEAAAAAGVDVLYVITGVRTAKATPESLPPNSKVEIVNAEEAELLKGYRELTEENRRLLRRAVSPPARDATRQVARKRANAK